MNWPIMTLGGEGGDRFLDNIGLAKFGAAEVFVVLFQQWSVT